MISDFEKNKQELLNKLKSLHPTANAKAAPDNAEAAPEAEIVVYGVECSFIDGIIETLKKKYSVESFGNHEDATRYCLDHSARIIVLDMDPPTDWKMSTDIFTNVKTMKPKTQFVLLTKEPQSIPVLTLAGQSAAVLGKPFSLEMLLHAIKRT